VDRLFELFFNPQIIRETLPLLLREGLKNTLILTVGAVAIGLVLGMVIALMGISRRWWVRLPAVVYIDIFRGLPAILTIVLIGTGLPIAGFRPFGRNQIAYGIAALGLISTAYIAEIFRAGIQSVDKGQMEAARSVGMSYSLAMRLVVIPQGIRRVLPPLTNEAIAILKDSALVFFIGTIAGNRELFRIGQSLQQQTGNSSPVVAAGLVYLLLTIPLTRLVNHLDRRLREGPQRTAGNDEELPAPALMGQDG
jgi:polar amino acid transport system permease protein